MPNLKCLLVLVVIGIPIIGVFDLHLEWLGVNSSLIRSVIRTLLVIPCIYVILAYLTDHFPSLRAKT